MSLRFPFQSKVNCGALKTGKTGECSYLGREVWLKWRWQIPLCGTSVGSDHGTYSGGDAQEANEKTEAELQKKLERQSQ